MIGDGWTNGRPRMWQGFADLGPIQIPPTPTYLVLTDRADGTLWWLSYNNTTDVRPDGFGDVSIISGTTPNAKQTVTYAAYAEPYLTQDLGRFARILVRGGYLGIEESTTPHITDASNLGVFARKAGLLIPMRRLILSVITPPDAIAGWYGWVPVDGHLNPL